MKELEFRYKNGDKVEAVNSRHYPRGTQLVIIDDRWAPIEKYKVSEISENSSSYRFISKDSIRLIQK